MILDEKLAREIYGSATPDCWNKEWKQVGRFGGGMAIELEVGEFLNALVRMTKPAVVVETGTHKGFSTLMIAQALKANGKGHLYTADLEDHGVAKECEQFGVASFVTFTKGDSAAVISKLSPAVKNIDFLWLDADHSMEAVIKELNAALPMLRKGTLVAFHDVITDPREAKAIEEIRKRFPTWEYLNFITARGFALMRVH